MELDKMISTLKSKFKSKSKLVNDSIPDPPRYPNQNDDFKEINFTQVNKKCEGEEEQRRDSKTEMNNYQKNNSTSANDDSETAAGRSDQPRKMNNNSKSNSTRFNKKKASYNNYIPPGNHTIYKDCKNLTIIGTINKNILNVKNTQNVMNNYNAMNNKYKQNRDGPKKISLELKALINCKIRITVEDTIVVKHYIGQNWRMVAEKIGCPSGTIDQLLHHYDNETYGEIMQRILIKWIQAEASHATFGKLLSELWKAEEYDCAEQLVIEYKRRNEEAPTSNID